MTSRYQGFYSVMATPTLDTNAYAPADLLAGITELTNVFQLGGSVLESVTVIDRDHQSGAFDIVLFRSAAAAASTLTLNGAFDLHDTDVAKVAGHVVVAATDYATAGASNAFATKTGIDLVVNPLTTESTTSLYFFLISRDSKTYTAGGLDLWFGFLRD